MVGHSSTEENSMATANTPTKVTQMNVPAKSLQIRVARRSPAYWRVTIDNPPINVMGPEMVKQFQEVINALEADEQVRVVVFDSAVDDYFLNHSDFTAKKGPDLAAGGHHGPAALAGLSCASDPLAGCVHRPHPRPGDRQRQRDHAGLRHELCQPREDHHLAMGSGRGHGRRRWPHGSASSAHRPKPRPRSAFKLGRYSSGAGRGLRLHQSRPA